MNKGIFYRLCFLLTVIQGGYAFFVLLSIPSDPQKAIFFGLSYERTLLIGLPIIVIVTCGFLFSKTWWDKGWIERFDYKIHSQLAQNHRLSIAFLVCGLLIVFGGIYTSAIAHKSFYVLAPPEHGLFSYMVYYVNQLYSATSPYLIRLQPLIILLTGISIQAIIILVLLAFETRVWDKRFKFHNGYIIFASYGMILILWKILGWTHLKLVPDNTSSQWLTLGTPILETQVLLVIVMGCVVISIVNLVNEFLESRRQPNTKRCLSTGSINYLF